MKKVRCKKQYGNWYYEKILPNVYNDLDAPIFVLENEQKTDGGEFGSYGDMKYYIETGINIG